MRHASLFSGIGGFDLAAQWMGWENVFQVEQDTFCQRVLAHHFPEAKIYGDIKEFDGLPYRGQVDIITGGFPCQPYSMAGKRLGKDDERHLWPEMLRVIREIAPAYVVGENVRGLLSWSGGLVFEEVCADLEAAGYEVWAGVLPAASVGAPHRRDRVWFVAHAKGQQSERVQFEQRKTSQQKQRQPRRAYSKSIHKQPTPDPTSDRRFWEWEAAPDETGRPQGRGEAGQLPGGLKRFCLVTAPSNAVSSGCKAKRKQPEPAAQSKRTINSGCRWDRFPAQPPVCGRDDGFPGQLDGLTFPKWREQSIKGFGNAIVPQVAHQIFRAIEKANQ